MMFSALELPANVWNEARGSVQAAHVFFLISCPIFIPTTPHAHSFSFSVFLSHTHTHTWGSSAKTLLKLIQQVNSSSLTFGIHLDRTCLSHRPAVYFVTLDTGLAASYGTYFSLEKQNGGSAGMFLKSPCIEWKSAHFILPVILRCTNSKMTYRCYENWRTDVRRIQSFFFFTQNNFITFFNWSTKQMDTAIYLFSPV